MADSEKVVERSAVAKQLKVSKKMTQVICSLVSLGRAGHRARARMLLQIPPQGSLPLEPQAAVSALAAAVLAAPAAPACAAAAAADTEDNKPGVVSIGILKNRNASFPGNR